MVKQRLFLGSVAFGISFGISLLTGRDVGRAIASGMTTTVAAVAAAVVVDRQAHQQAHQQAHTRIADLKSHIHALQQRRTEAYHDYRELEAAKEQLAANLQALALQSGQPQFGSVPSPRALPAAHKALSWNLAALANSEQSIAVQPYELPTEISADRRSPWSQPGDNQAAGEITKHVRSEAVVAKQKIAASLTALQAELSQLKGQISDHRQTREKLARDVANVREEKRQLEATAKTLKGEVKALETNRIDLEQSLTDAAAKKQALETGSSPLQKALEQLEMRVNTVQAELRVLEAQRLDRHSQKEALEQQLAALGTALLAANASLQPELTDRQSLDPTATNGNGKHTEAHAHITAPNGLPKPLLAPRQSARPKHAPVTVNATSESGQSHADQPGTATLLPEPIAAEKSSADLPNEWTEFMVQLPEYELQALKVIVEQTHPAAALKHLAEANLTMPELLLDSINERALDTIGDLLIDAGAGAGSATIVRDHLKTVKKLLKTYEYLVN